MARLDPEVAKARMIDRGVWPVEVFRNTQVKWLCVCMKCGDFVTPRYNNTVNKEIGGCRPCGTVTTINKLRLDPNIAKARMIERNLWPVSKFETTVARWLCVCLECGEFVSPTYGNVVSNGQMGCQPCSIRSRTKNATEAKAEMIARGVWPIEHFRNTSDNWLCVCMKCGQFVTPRYNSVIHKGNGGCEYCGRKEIDPAKAKQVMIGHGLWPIERFPGGNHPWLCICMECGEYIKPRYSGTAGRGRGCKFCAGVAIDPEKAKARMISRGIWPIEPFKKSDERWLSVCMKCGEFNSPRYDSVASGAQGGCQACSTSGFKANEPAMLYLVISHAFNAAKIGICNFGTGRIKKHERNGWQLWKVYTFDLGVHARQAEQAVLQKWRSRGEGWGPVIVPETEAYDGFTETVSLSRANGKRTSIATLWSDVVRVITEWQLEVAGTPLSDKTPGRSVDVTPTMYLQATAE